MSVPVENPFAEHPRRFAANRYVYPVISRRAGGVSIGVNLSLDKFCNFRCIYCQVDRSVTGKPQPIDLRRLDEELQETVDLARSGQLFQAVQFSQTPAALRRLSDIAFSGDGEPTAHPDFEQAVAVGAAVRRRNGLQELKLVLITNGSLLHQPGVARALELLEANNGEIWAKLDAGTEAAYRQIARSAIPWGQILENLLAAARVRPIVIQSLFSRLHGLPPLAEEVDARCARLRAIVAAGGQIKLVQVYTLARKPAEDWVAPLTNAEVDAVAERVRRQTGLNVRAFYSL